MEKIQVRMKLGKDRHAFLISRSLLSNYRIKNNHAYNDDGTVTFDLYDPPESYLNLMKTYGEIK